MKKYKYVLQNLECANCANKIQNEIAKQQGFNKVNVNFSTLILSFETERTDLEKTIKQIISKIEPEVIVKNENEQEKTNLPKKNAIPIIRLITGIILASIGCFTKLPYELNTYITIIAYAVLLYRTAKNAIKLIVKSRTINENFLIIISCIGAYLVGEHKEGLMVIILYEIGKILEERAINKSRRSIKELMNIKPEYANLKIGNSYKRVTPEEIKVGDIIVVKQGEKIPLDGKIIYGNAELDTSTLTGESILRKVNVKDEVLSGSINVKGLIEIQTTRPYSSSTVNQIIELAQNATEKKAKTETFVNKAAKIYTPTVLLLAIIIALFMPVFVEGITYNQSIYKALIFLVISCPCSIAISVPLSYFSGIGKASRNGILIKGSNYLDELKNIKEIIFDKTGTITSGSFNVSEINCFDSEYNEEKILEIIAKGEKFSNHPIAKSILKRVRKDINVSDVEDFKEISGKGIEYKLENSKIKVGNNEFVGFSKNSNKDNGTVIYLKVDNTIVGNLIIKDDIKKEAKVIIDKLNRLGIKTKMFTGDNKDIADKIAKQIGIQEVKSEMLPADKYMELEKIIKVNKVNDYKVSYVGDGINDSPVLALSDIGISMGGVGSEVAIEASDIVIITDDLNKIIQAIEISNKTIKTIKQNLVFAICTKVIILLCSVLGIAGMWEAIFADVGVTLLTILNTLRIIR